jgi:peptidylprolyl isomerase
MSAPASAQDQPEASLSPGEIVAQAQPSEWKEIPADDLLVMTLAPDAEGKPRKVVIQLMPAPFSQGWVENIRTFARAHWYDNITVNRVQDNYVVQWGDVNYDNPEATGKPKPLPEGLRATSECDYAAEFITGDVITDHCDWLQRERAMLDPAFRARFDAKSTAAEANARSVGEAAAQAAEAVAEEMGASLGLPSFAENQEIGQPTEMGPDWWTRDPYSSGTAMVEGWPVALSHDSGMMWPVHCYGMVGVGRNLSPDAGSGAELYTVIGTPPRHLDRNIALVGRIVEGMEYLSSLPRGHGDLGFYAADEADKRTPILSVRVASDLPPAERPRFEFLSDEGKTFARYADARANRRDAFFNVPAGGADICNIPVPIRRIEK